MPLSAHLLLAATALCCIATVFALPMDGFSVGHQCRCLSITSYFIDPRAFKKIMIVPAGSHCVTLELIITLRDGRTVCLDPEKDWVKNIIYKYIQRYKAMKKLEV